MRTPLSPPLGENALAVTAVPLSPTPRLMLFVTIAFLALLMALAPAEATATVAHFARLKSGPWCDDLSDVSKQSPIIRAVEALETRQFLDGHGLTATYYNGTNPPDPISGSPSIVSVTRVDPTVNFYWGSAAPAAGITVDKFSARWVGQVEARYSETYTFSTRTDEGVRLWIDGKLIIDAWSRHRLQTDAGSITLQAGKRYDVRMEYYDFSGTAVARLMWQSASQPLEDVPTSQLYAQAPFNTPAAQPGTRIEAENFDQGANGVAYGDDAGNLGKAYRTTDVDIQASKDAGGGYNVGWSRAGEWLEYTVDVPTAGTYSLDLRLSGMGAGGLFHVNVDGVNATGSLAVPNTGNWQIWTTLTASNINMTAGRHVLRISQDTAGSSGYVSNLNWLMLRQTTPQAVAVSVGGVPIPNGQVLPVEFGTYERGTTGPTLSFQVTNSTAGTLSLSGLSLPSGFSLVEGLSSTLAAGASDTFTVRLDTADEGRKTGVVQFSTSDPAASSFAFRIGGTITAPHMKVKRGTSDVNPGDAVNFGTATIGSAGPSIVFTVVNEGTATMTLGAPNLPGGFTLTEGLPSTLAPGAADTFTVTLDTGNVGFCSGSISVASNDTDVNPFVFAATGVVSTVTQPPPTTNPLLVPGSGWTGPTIQPAAIGDPAANGYSAKAIARWDVVPFQTFGGNLNIGVVAFHINYIDHVAFSVNGGDWSNVTTMTKNPQTDVYEYWATLRASDFADGQLEVRAIAYPKTGVARVLDPLILYANATATLNPPPVWVSMTGSDSSGDGSQARPYASIVKATTVAAAGADIYLTSGSYPITERFSGFRDGQSRWVNVRPAPGLTKADVRVVVSSAVSMRADKLAFHDVRLDLSAGQALCNSAQNDAGHIWLDNVDVFGSLASGGITVSPLQPNFGGKIYVTDSIVHDVAYTPMTWVEMVRNTRIYDCYAHGVNDPQLLVNSTIDNIVPRPSFPDDHVDGIFWYNPNQESNSIVYGVEMTNIQGLTIFADRPGSNMAVVNLKATASGVGVGGAVQFGKGIYENYLDHLVFDNLTLTNQQFYFVDDTPNNHWSNSIIRNSIVQSLFSVNPANRVVNVRLADGTLLPDK